MENGEEIGLDLLMSQIPARAFADSDKENSEEHFGCHNCVTKEEQILSYSKGFVPKSTSQNPITALKNFNSWCFWWSNMVLL